MRFESLTNDQKSKLIELGVLNGCGPGNWRMKFDWFFKTSCFEHDWNYAVGGDEGDRRWCDAGFYAAMKKDILRLAWWQKPYARLKARFAYLAVCFLGKKRFHYGPKRTYREIVGANKS